MLCLLVEREKIQEKIVSVPLIIFIESSQVNIYKVHNLLIGNVGNRFFFKNIYFSIVYIIIL